MVNSVKLRINREISWFYNGKKVIENDGYFIRVSDGTVYAWMDDGSLS